MNNSDFTIYICGPRSGMPGTNIEGIRSTAENLREKGFNVIEPVAVNMAFLGTTYSPHNPGSVRTFPGLRADIFALLSCCNAIALMPGWNDAVGCRVEVAICITFGYTFVDWITGEIVPRPGGVMVDRGYGERSLEIETVRAEREVSRR